MTPNAEEQQLIHHRALRDAAWALLKDDVAALREDVDQRGLGARLADRVGEEAREIWGQTIEVAEAHRGVVAATLVALVAWLMRGPIVQAVGALLGSGEDERLAPAEEPVRANGEGDRT